MKAIKLLIHGKVQGVGYRRWFEKEAIQLQLKGYVKNLENGDVEAVIVGDEQVILSIIRQSYIGPLRANVSSIQQQVLECENVEYTDFQMIL